MGTDFDLLLPFERTRIRRGLDNSIRYEKYLANFATGYINVRFFTHCILSDLGKLDLIRYMSDFLADNSRKSSYFSNDISIWIIHQWKSNV